VDRRLLNNTDNILTVISYPLDRFHRNDGLLNLTLNNQSFHPPEFKDVAVERAVGITHAARWICSAGRFSQCSWPPSKQSLCPQISSLSSRQPRALRRSASSLLTIIQWFSLLWVRRPLKILGRALTDRKWPVLYNEFPSASTPISKAAISCGRSRPDPASSPAWPVSSSCGYGYGAIGLVSYSSSQTLTCHEAMSPARIPDAMAQATPVCAFCFSLLVRRRA